MSLWSAIGDVFGGKRDNAPSAMSAGQVASMTGAPVAGADKVLGFLDNHFGGHPATQFTTFNTDGTVKSQTAPGQETGGLIGNTLSALSYVPNQALHGLSAAYNVGDVANAEGFSQLHPLVSLSIWKDSWNRTSGFMSDPSRPSFGASVYHSALQKEADKPSGGVFGTTAANKADLAKLQAEQKTWTGMAVGGLIDTVASWKADPLLLAGKAAGRTRVALKTGGLSPEDATSVAEAASAINTGDAPVVHNPFSTGMERSGSQLFQAMKSFDNGGNLAGRQVLVNRTPETAPFLALMDQADNIPDLELQRQVRIDTVGTLQGSSVSRDRLISSAPELARSVMRTQLAPEGRPALDSLHDALANVDVTNPASAARAARTWVDAASSFGSVENRAEIAALHTKALRSIHDSMERLAQVGLETPLEQSGLTALDRSRAFLRNKVAQDFHYQDGASGTTVRVLHWATNQRFRGTIATDHAIRGNQELMDWMTRAKIQHPETGDRVPLFSGAERRAQSDQFMLAKTQEQRRRQVDNLKTLLYAKVGAVHGKDAEWARHMANLDTQFTQGAVRYATKELETARLAGDDVVTLDDPHFGTPTRIKAALLETHIANNASLPDANMVVKAVRQRVSGVSARDALEAKGAQFNNYADHFNNVWRLAVLGRPGLLVRTQIDSQGRALATMHGTAYVHSALSGIKNLVAKDLAKSFSIDTLARVDATAADHALADDLREEAAQLHATASRNERIAKQRRGVEPSASVVAPTLDDRGRILRGEGKQSDLPLDADSIAQLSPAAMHAAADLKLQKAAELDARTYETQRFRAGTQDFEINLGKGRKVKSRLATNTQDLNDLRSAEYKGGSQSDALMQTPPKSMDEVLSRSVTRQQKKLYEDSKNYVTHNPGDPHWAAGWLRTMDVFRNSYVGRKVLELADLSTHDLITSLRRDPQVHAFYAEVRSDNENFEEWLARVTNSVIWNAPTKEVRQALITRGHMSPDEVSKMFAEFGDSASTLPQQMHVQGPHFDFKPPAGYKPPTAVRRMIAALSDVPDSVAARHPVTVDRYRHHLTQLAKRSFDQHPEWGTELPAREQARIEKIAKHRAVQDTQQIFYDTAKNTGAHNSLRYVSPFMGAWQDAIESWSRLMYDDPAVAGGFNKLWNAPNRMGLVVDQNGDAIPPGGQANQSFLVLPAEFSNDFKNSKKVVIRKDSLNSIFQGAQWYTPGVGPLVQWPAEEIIAQVYPELGDSKNPLVQSILPFGTPKTHDGLSGKAADLVNATAPSWVKALYSLKHPDDAGNSLNMTVLSSINQQIIDARKAGKPIPSHDVLLKNAIGAARSVGILKAIAIGGFGVSADSQGPVDFYKKQHDLLEGQAAQLHAQGTTPDAEFVKQFPEAAGLRWTLSKTQTGVNASLQAWDTEKKYSKQIKANPDFGWFYVGAANLSGDFSQSVYNAQSSRTLGDRGTGTERVRFTGSQIADQAIAEDGWQKYNQINLAISAASNAPDANPDAVAFAKREAVAALRQSNPAWAKDFDTGQDRGKLQRFIDNIATPALADPALKNRTDIKALGQYLGARQQVLDFLKTRGLTSLDSKAAAPLAAALDAIGQQLADQNLGFQQMWTRMFSSEVGDTKPTPQAAA